METEVKQIELDKYDKMWIKLIKGHYKDKYPMNARNWPETLMPMFVEIYGWSHKEFYNDFLTGVFYKLFDIYLKIQLDRSGTNVHLKDIISASFAIRCSREYVLPAERVIAEICGLIQCNTVIDNGFVRYNLDD